MNFPTMMMRSCWRHWLTGIHVAAVDPSRVYGTYGAGAGAGAAPGGRMGRERSVAIVLRFATSRYDCGVRYAIQVENVAAKQQQQRKVHP